MERRDRDASELRLDAVAARLGAVNNSCPVSHCAVGWAWRVVARSVLVIGSCAYVAAAASLCEVAARRLNDSGAAFYITVVRFFSFGLCPSAVLVISAVLAPSAIYSGSGFGSAVVGVNPGSLGAIRTAYGPKFEVCPIDK